MATLVSGDTSQDTDLIVAFAESASMAATESEDVDLDSMTDEEREASINDQIFRCLGTQTLLTWSEMLQEFGNVVSSCSTPIYNGYYKTNF